MLVENETGVVSVLTQDNSSDFNDLTTREIQLMPINVITKMKVGSSSFNNHF